MMEPITAPRYLIHKACAHPVVICWIIGTLLGWIAISFDLERKGVFQILHDTWTLILLLLLGYSAISGLGFVFGVLFLSWVVLPLCRRMNGAPPKVGDRVLVLSGPF